MSTCPQNLINLLRVLDTLPVRYLHDRVTFQHRGAAVTHFPGTQLPMQIEGEFEDGTLVYSDRWICCGEYGCTSGDASLKKKTRNHHCAARMTLRVKVACGGLCLLSIVEDGEHGDGFEAPDSADRNDWRSKMIVAVAVDSGVKTLADLLTDKWWPLAMAPRPRTDNEKKSMRRLANQVKKRGCEARAEAAVVNDENEEN